MVALVELIRLTPEAALTGRWSEVATDDGRRAVAALCEHVCREDERGLFALLALATACDRITSRAMTHTELRRGRSAEFVRDRVATFPAAAAWARALIATVTGPASASAVSGLLYAVVDVHRRGGPLRGFRKVAQQRTPVGFMVGDEALPDLEPATVKAAVEAYNARHAMCDVPADMDPTRLVLAEVLAMVERTRRRPGRYHAARKTDPIDLARPALGLFAGDGFGHHALSGGAVFDRTDAQWHVTPRFHADDLASDLLAGVRLLGARTAARDVTREWLAAGRSTEADLAGWQAQLDRAEHVVSGMARRSLLFASEHGHTTVAVGSDPVSFDVARSLLVPH